MKKGFTLIELLAVIAILAIIMLIATPRIMDAIENSRISAYKQDEQMMIKATKTYFGNNVDLLPENIGDTVEITLSELKTNEMISEINDCNGYVLVTKTEEGYSYNPELKCGDSKTIAGSTDDNLIAHYTFDDFQEPTENLLIYKPYIKNLTLGESTIYNHGYGDVKYTRIAENEYKLELIDNISGQAQLAMAESIHWYSDQKTTISAEITDYYVNPTSTALFGLSRVSYGDTHLKYVGYHQYSYYAWLDEIDITSDIGWRTSWIENSSVDSGSYIKFKNFQAERKSYATPYTEGIREGIVKDYSINNNLINLDMATTPRWMEENGNGFYQFDGATTYIATPSTPADFTNLNQLTVSAWVQSGTIEEMDCIFYLNALRTYIQDDGIIEVIFTSKAGEQVVKYSSNKVNTGYNGWDKVTFTYDGTNFISYINGKKEEALSFELIGEIANGINFQIGKYPSDTYPHWYNGYIDDVKIYNRALSAEEIKYQYDTKKEIYN